MENVYYSYRISPYGAPKIRAVKKEQKLYLWDWSELEDPGARWENFIASHLLKFCHYHEDVYADKMEIRFLRDIDGREVDFVVLKNKKPLFAVECKTGEKNYLQIYIILLNVLIFLIFIKSIWELNTIQLQIESRFYLFLSFAK